ncbi:hypothetical protein [uncultured Sulfitobacter sp.]|uniref:hypothetical protein n=1 Tax=uncultured Sulfitobacter sp. TaxID=191468 RepID=UPI002610A4BE|nr:hypothetical protein [uncultured Sulfitobacter sp.]
MSAVKGKMLSRRSFTEGTAVARTTSAMGTPAMAAAGATLVIVAPKHRCSSGGPARIFTML